MRAVPVSLILIVCSCAASAPRTFDTSFDRAWDEDSLNQAVQSREEYFKWIALFYDGSTFVQGWTRRQAELCSALKPEEAREAQPKLEEFGRLVAAEWAKDNKRRKIDSDLVSRLAAILAHARDAGRLLEVLDALREDIRSVIAGERAAKTITPERYEKLLAIR